MDNENPFKYKCYPCNDIFDEECRIHTLEGICFNCGWVTLDNYGNCPKSNKHPVIERKEKYRRTYEDAIQKPYVPSLHNRLEDLRHNFISSVYRLRKRRARQTEAREKNVPCDR